MANIAQIVNVLQSVILTEGSEMVKTPTYHIFRMYRDHQDATLLDSYIENDTVTSGEFTVPTLSQSVSINEENKVLVTISNCSLEEASEVEVDMIGKSVVSCSSEILCADVKAYHTFEQSGEVKPTAYEEFKIVDQKLILTVPTCSVISLVIE